MLPENEDPPLPFLRRTGQWLVYAIFRVIESLLRLMPMGLAARGGRVLGWLAWYAFATYRELILRNLRIAFGREIPEGELRKLGRTHLSTLTGNLLCSLKIPWLSTEAVGRLVTIRGQEHVTAAREQGRGLILAICHSGNWEVLTHVDFTPGMKPSAMFQRLGNRYLNAHVERLRSRSGCTLFDRRSGFGAPAAWLRGNNAIGILVDQHAGDAGVWCPLFGKLASTTNLAALLAKRTGAAVLPMMVTTDGPGRWTATISAPLPGVAEGLDPDHATAEMNLALEQLIRQSPADWFWVHNRWKIPDPEFLLTNYRRGMVLPAGWTVDRLQKFEILIRSPNWLGDACMAVPAVRAIRRGRPDCRVTVLVKEKIADVWKLVPEVDEILPIPGRTGIWGVKNLIARCGRAFDAAILLPNSLRTALEVWLPGIPRIAGYRGHWRSWLVDQIIPKRKRPGPIMHHAVHYLRIARRAGGDVRDESLFDPVPRPDRSPAEAPQIGLCPGAEYGPAKRWPAERFAEAAKLVNKRVPAQWFIFGTAAEAELGSTLAQEIGPAAISLAGRTTLQELFARLRSCDVLLTNDTGTMHLAVLLGVPTVSIFGSTEPAWTGPLGGEASGHTVLRYQVPCSPCFLRECPLDFRCMTSISPARAAEAVLRRLEAPAGVRP